MGRAGQVLAVKIVPHLSESLILYTEWIKPRSRTSSGAAVFGGIMNAVFDGVGLFRFCLPNKVDDPSELLLADLAGTETAGIRCRRAVMNPYHAPALAALADS